MRSGRVPPLGHTLPPQVPLLGHARWAPASAFCTVKAGLKDDSSTGWGQIFARVTVEARNYCMQQVIINGTPLTDSDLKTVWTNLNEDETYNVRSVAYLTIYNAHQLGQSRPSLTTDLSDTQRLLARYNGTGDDAEQYGRELIGLYTVLENYNKLSRSS